MKNQKIQKGTSVLTLVLTLTVIVSPFSTLSENPAEVVEQDIYSPILKSTLEYSPATVFSAPLPLMNIYDNSQLLSDVGDKIEGTNALFDRPTSIYSTFYAYITLEKLDQVHFEDRKDDLEQFLLSKYNPTSFHFEEPIDYSMYHEEGSNLFKTPYTFNITHQMAVILLANIDRLESNFDPLQILAWENEIIDGLNPDGGFGSIFTPSSTLMETFYAIWAVKAMKDYKITAFSPLERGKIQSFIESKQRSDMFRGVFNEYDSSAFHGWDNYFTSWQALKIIDMIDGDFAPVRDSFITFLQTFSVFNPVQSCYYGTFNDRLNSETATYFGTAIIADCIRMVEAQDDFPEISSVLTTLLNSTSYNRTLQTSGPNYFSYSSASFVTDELFIQYMIIPIVDNFGLIPVLDDSNHNLEGLQAFIKTYFSSNGGASYITKADQSAHGDFVKFAYLESDINAIQRENLLTTALSRLTTGYFTDYVNFSTTSQLPSNKIIALWQVWSYYPIASNYFILDTLHRLDLMEDLYDSIGFTAYLEMEQWIADQLLSGGFFLNDTHLGYQTGNLKSTYYALASQEILIDFNRGQTFANYYSVDNFTSMVTYLNQFMIETEEQWYGAAGEGENSDLSQVEMTYYLLRINEILATNQINYEKLTTFIQEKQESFPDMAYGEKTFFLRLCNYLQIEFTLEFFQQVHPDIQTICNHLLDSDQIYNDELMFLSEILRNPQVCIAIEMPSHQVIDSSYTYSIQGFSLASELPLTDIALHGEEQTFEAWNIMGKKYSCEIIPEANQTHPEEWQPTLTFSHGYDQYGGVLSVELTYSWEAAFVIGLDDPLDTITYTVQSQPSIISKITPQFEIRNLEGELIYTFTEINVDATYLDDSVEFTCILNTVVNKDQPYQFIPIFQESWAPYQSYDFQLNSSSTSTDTTTNTTTTDTSTTTNTTTTDTSTTTNTTTTDTSTTTNTTTTDTSTTTNTTTTDTSTTTTNTTTTDTSTTTNTTTTGTSTTTDITDTTSDYSTSATDSSDDSGSSHSGGTSSSSTNETLTDENNLPDSYNIPNSIIYFSSFVLIGGVSIIVKKKSQMH